VKPRLLVVALVAVMLLFPLLITESKAEYTTPIVWSDQKEYDPSATASLFGYGFNAFSPITITIVRPDSVEDTVETSTDEFGYFSTQYLLDGLHGTFNVTATDGVHVAKTSFDNCLYLRAWWKTSCCNYIHAKAGGLKKSKSYYIKYFDPAGIERRQSPTHTGVRWFKDKFAISPTLPNILGWWAVRLYENDVLKRTKWVYINKMVWTTDSTFTTMITSFEQGDTIYFKAIGLLSAKYHRFQFEMPNGTRFYVGDWFTGVTSKTGDYTLPISAPIGDWKLHVRKADDASGTKEKHYVDCCFTVTEAPQPQQYYLTVQTDPSGIGTIPGEGWYNESTHVNLTAPDIIPGATGIQYRFDYWDVDGVSQGAGVDEISVYMDANHTATAHYITQYYLNLTTNPPSVTIPAGIGWYDAGTNASIFAPEFVGIVPSDSRYRFDGWTTGDMSEIANASATSTTVLMDKAKTVTANYVTQYFVTFNQTGLDTTANSNVVTVNGVPKGFADLPYSMWLDNSSVVTYSYNSIVSSSTSGKQFSLINVNGPSSPITVTSAVTVTGNYKTQYYLTMSTNFGTVSPGNGWHDAGSIVSISATPPSTVSGERYVWNGWTGTGTGSYSGLNNPASITMDGPITETASWTHEYRLIMATNYGTTSPSVGEHWYEAGAIVEVNATAPSVIPGEQYLWNGWTGAGTGSYTGLNNPASITMNAPINETASWTHQYYLTVTSPYDTPGGEGWYNSGDTAYATLTTGLIDHGNGTRRIFTSWSGDASGTNYAQSDPILMNAPKTATANWKTQYYLTLATNPSGVTTPSGEGWYDAGTYASISTDALVDIVLGSSRYNFSGWTTADMPEITDPASPSTTVLIDKPKTVTANYTTQYYLTLTATTGGVTDPPSSAWYDAGTTVSVTAIPDTYYLFDHWELDSVNVGSDNPYNVTMDTAHTLHAVFVYSPTTYYLTVKTDPPSVTTISGEGWYNESESVLLTAHMDANHTATAHYTLQYYLTVTSPYDSPTPTSGWFDDGASITASVTSPWSGPAGTRYVCTGWTGTGSVPASGTTTSVTFTINAPSSITWNWKTQYYLTVKTSPSGIATIPGEGWYDESTSVPLAAPSVSGYMFLHWDVDGVSQGAGVASISVSMNAPHTATANYKFIVVGGSTVSLKSPLFSTWVSLNVVLIAAIFVAASWMKKRRRKTG